MGPKVAKVVKVLVVTICVLIGFSPTLLALLVKLSLSFSDGDPFRPHMLEIESRADIMKITERTYVLEISSLPAWDYPLLRNYPWIATIEIYGGPIGDSCIRELVGVTELKQLEVGSADFVTDFGLSHLRECKELRKVILSSSSLITWSGVEDLISDSKIEELAVSLTAVPTSDVLIASMQNSRIRTLEIEPLELKNLSVLRHSRIVTTNRNGEECRVLIR